MKWNWTLLFIVIFLPACTVGPDFVRPDPPATEKYTNDKKLDQFGSQKLKKNKLVSEIWWKEFSSPELNTVVERGLKNSHTLNAMRKNIEQAEQLMKAEKALLWPTLGLEVEAGRQKYGEAFLGSSNFLIPPFTYYEVGPTFSYLIDIFGATRRGIEAQQALAEYQRHAYDAAVLALTGKIVGTSLTIANINTQLEIAREVIREDRETLKLVEESYALGAVTKNDVLDAKNQLSTDLTLLPVLSLQLSRAKNELRTLVGSTPAEWTPPRFQLKNFKLPEELPLSLPSTLVRTRPDILAAEAILHSASANIGIATANMYPSILLTGNLLQEALTPRNLFLASSNAWNYLGTLTSPLFNAGMLSAQKRSAVAAYEASFSNYQDVVVKSLVQVNDVLHALKEDEIAEHLQRSTMNNTKDAFDLAQMKMKEGGAGRLDVLTAERHYRQARMLYLRAKAQRYQDTVQLYLALGGKTQFPSKGK
jgi:NodT family efflux transporter outer membrane factor (OMF) lipoprotein